MSLRDEAIAQFKATMEMEEVLCGLVRRVAQLQPQTVLIAWELNGKVDMVTVPDSWLLARSYADALYDATWGANDADDSDDDADGAVD